MCLCICYLLFCDALSHNCQLRFGSMNMYPKISAGISYKIYNIYDIFEVLPTTKFVKTTPELLLNE